MQPPIMLRCKTAAAGNLLHLLLTVPKQDNLGADGAAVTGRPFQFKFNPLVLRCHRVLVKQQRPVLIGHNHIEHATIPQIHQRHRTSVIPIRSADRLGNIDKLSGAIVEPDPLVLIARQTAPFKCRPVLRIADDGTVSPRYPGKVVPITPVPVERDITICKIQVQRSVVIEIAKLRAKTPSPKFHAKVPRQVLILDRVASSTFLRDPQIVPLNEDAVLGNVGNVDRVPALIENVAKRGVHPALRSEADARLLANFVEAFTVVEVKLRHSVIIPNKQIGMAPPAQIRRGSRQCPTPALDSNFCADVFKFAVPEIVKQILSPAVLGVLKTVGHDARRRGMPKINVFGVVAADEKVQKPVAVVIEPDRRVRINPRRQSSLLSYAREAVAPVVVKQLWTSPLDQEQVFISIIVEIPPDRAG